MQDVVLHRITLRGSAPAVESARARIKTELEQSSWPDTAPDELLFLRKISCHGDPREIAARAASEARRLAAEAVDGWSTAATYAMAVRFRSRAEMLACLIRDLLQGGAPSIWYWRRWKTASERPADEAITAVLEEAPLSLPSVLAHLQGTPVWRTFWVTLGVKASERLLAIVAHAGGWSTCLQGARDAASRVETRSAEGQAVRSAAPSMGNETAHRADLSAAPVMETIQTWLVPPDLSFLNSAPNDPRFLLAALVTLWRHSPAMLNHPSGAMQLVRLAEIAAGGPLPAESASSSETHAPFTAATPLPRNPQPNLPDAPATTAAANEQTDRITAASSGQSESHGTNLVAAEKTALQDRSNAAAPANNEQTWTIAARVKQSESHGENFVANDFLTRQGGIFYLLNFLNLPSVQAKIGAAGPEIRNIPGAGWRWLYDLACAVGCPPEGALLDFLAGECSMGSGVALSQQPPAIETDPLLRLGAGRYGDEPWQDATWRLPARAIATASHIDVHFRLADTRLAIRRVGLDINPGWLPWLGRVVTFHYGSGKEPAK